MYAGLTSHLGAIHLRDLEDPKGFSISLGRFSEQHQK
jgi:hypothetical protein